MQAGENHAVRASTRTYMYLLDYSRFPDMSSPGASLSVPELPTPAFPEVDDNRAQHECLEWIGRWNSVLARCGMIQTGSRILRLVNYV